MKSVAVLITCHNRKQKTLACLRSLFSVLPEAKVYLTDDGCIDGTTKAVLQEFPEVVVLQGDGSLFWNRGMHRAWLEAQKGNYDFFLWLNDDVELYSNAIEQLFDACIGGKAVVSGLIEDARTHEILYGGCDRKKRVVQRGNNPQSIFWMNGNVVLVPRSIVEIVGILDPYFIHDLGDVDYGMRVREAGFEVLSTVNAVASGTRNKVCRVRKWGVSLHKRFLCLQTPLGSPLKQNYHFRSRHFGILHALAYCAHLCVLNILPDRLVGYLWGDTYKEK